MMGRTRASATTENARAAGRASAKRFAEDEQAREQRAAAMRAALATPEVRARLSEAAKAREAMAREKRAAKEVAARDRRVAREAVALANRMANAPFPAWCERAGLDAHFREAFASCGCEIEAARRCREARG